MSLFYVIIYIMLENVPKCGIYKISLPKGDKYFPSPIYIGQSTKIEMRWEAHRKNINKFLNIFKEYNKLTDFKNKLGNLNFDYEEVNNFINTNSWNVKNAFYLKIASFMFLKNYEMKDLKFEVLITLDKEWVSNIQDELLKQEQLYLSVNNFEAERCGFNGLSSKFQLMTFNKNGFTSKDFSNERYILEQKKREWMNLPHSVLFESYNTDYFKRLKVKMTKGKITKRRINKLTKKPKIRRTY